MRLKHPNVYRELENSYELCIIYKNNVYYTYFDKTIYESVNKHHWRISKKANKYYVCTGQAKNESKILYMSNIIMNFTPDCIHEVDHIDGNSLNNKSDNLRIILKTHNRQNVQVRCDNNSTGIRGVSTHTDGSYKVDFTYNGKRFYFKHFKILEEAIYIRLLCEIKFLKEFRNTSDDEYKNFIISKLSEIEKLELQEYFNSKVK